MKKILLILSIFFVVLIVPFRISAQTDTPTPTPTPDSSNSDQISQLESKISDLQGKISDLQGQEKTLSNTIAVMNDQISLSETQIEATKQKITKINADISASQTQITQLNSSLKDLTKLLYARIVATYETGDVAPVTVLAASNSLQNYVTSSSYIQMVQEHDKKLIYDMKASQDSYVNIKQIRENQKQQVQDLQTQLIQEQQQLDAQKQQKETLLAQTQGSEANYQQELAATQAQLASFHGFVTSQGGASLLSGQTSCDDWGCYYNQRDSQWGGSALNGTQYTIADSGCLMTSMAMVYTHYGHKDVTPATINSNSNNFGGIPAALLKYTINANGVSSSRVHLGSSSGAIPGTISDPIIVGISYDGGPLADHFVVLVSGSGGNYNMNDPFTPNGHNIPFTSHYSLGSIVEVESVSM